MNSKLKSIKKTKKKKMNQILWIFFFFWNDKVKWWYANWCNDQGLGPNPSVMPNGMNGPLRAVPYPPVLPLMHPALRGLCKPSQSLAIGLAAGTKHNKP